MLNQGYALLGDEVFPLYGFAGYKNIDFGNFSTVNIFAQPITRWDYAGTASTVGGGGRYKGLNVTASLLGGGVQGAEDYYGSGLWRVYNYPNYYTTSNKAPNYAFNTSYNACMFGFDWTVGAGYMHGLWLGSPQNGFYNSNIGAWDINLQAHTQHVKLLAEFVKSTPDVNSVGKFTPTIPGAANLQTWDVGMSYAWNDFLLPHESIVNIDYSGVVGNNSFVQVTQLVLGVIHHIRNPFWVGIEYVYIDQSSNQDANRSGLFFRNHDNLEVVRIDFTASF